MEDTHKWKTTLDESWPWTEDDLGKKMTLDGRGP